MTATTLRHPDVVAALLTAMTTKASNSPRGMSLVQLGERLLPGLREQTFASAVMLHLQDYLRSLFIGCPLRLAPFEEGAEDFISKAVIL